MKIKFLFPLFIALLFASCFSQKGLSNSGKKLYESFFVGNEGVQYFIKPLYFKSDNDKFNLDFTFRNKNDSNSNVNINYSIKSKNLIKSIDSIQIISDLSQITLLNNKLLFKEFKGKLFQSRFNGSTTLYNLMPLFKNNNWRITVFENEENAIYLPSKKSKKAISKLNKFLFVLF